MHFIVFILLSSISYSAEIYRPNPTLSPGLGKDMDLKTLCTSGYTATVRNVPQAKKKEVFKAYGIEWKDHGKYEVDHLISLQLGGLNFIEGKPATLNLWPQRYCPLKEGGKTCFGAREKDVVEGALHRQVCKGKMKLSEAQAIAARDWFSYYKTIKGIK